MVIKTEPCAFSGYKIYPGHGMRYVPVIATQATRPVFPFAFKKARLLFLKRRNPRVISWSQLYRRKHKKNTVETIKKLRKTKAQKSERGFVGASLEFIKSKVQENIEAKKKAPAPAAKKEKKAATKTEKTAQQATKTQQQKAQKSQQAQKQQRGGAKSKQSR